MERFSVIMPRMSLSFVLFTPPAPSEIYTLSLHDASSDLGTLLTTLLPAASAADRIALPPRDPGSGAGSRAHASSDRKSTRLNSSHVEISYAVFCLKKKKYENPSHTSSLPPSHA